MKSTREIRTATEESRTVTVAKPDADQYESSDSSFVLIYPKSPLLGRRYVLGSAPVVFGRGSDCAIANPDTSVSRHHAQVHLGADGRYRVTDLGSTNGTFVNHTQVQERVLEDGDYMRIGNCIYRFLEGGNLEAEYHEEIYRQIGRAHV